MPNTSEKIRIQNALIVLGQAGPFYAVTYDPTTKLAADIEIGVDPTVTPPWVISNEIQAEFDPDPRHGRDRKLRRMSWSWILICRFNEEVTPFEAEWLWLNSPPILPRTADFPEQVTLDLLRTTYTHPTTQSSYSGSQIEFTFEARLSRR